MLVCARVGARQKCLSIKKKLNTIMPKVLAGAHCGTVKVLQVGHKRLYLHRSYIYNI